MEYCSALCDSAEFVDKWNTIIVLCIDCDLIILVSFIIVTKWFSLAINEILKLSEFIDRKSTSFLEIKIK